MVAGSAAIPLFRRDGLLCAEECAGILRTLTVCEDAPAIISAKGSGTLRVDESRRCCHRISAPDLLAERLEAVFSGVLPQAAAELGVDPGHLQPLQFLVYRKGDFFGRHSDSGTEAYYPASVRARKVSMILFLNGSDDAGKPGFAGGALKIYAGQGKDAAAREINPTAGTLIAFASARDHEVLPIIEGERYSVVCWCE